MLYITALLEISTMAKAVFTTSDLSRRSGDILAEATRRPVTITQRNKPRFVLLNVEDYNQLRKYADHRRAYKIEDIPDDLFEDIVKAFEDYANEPHDDA
jgi:prevent-host-death family protein